MSGPVDMAAAVAATQASFAADALVQAAPGTAGRRERMRAIIGEIADAFGVERVDLTMALTQASVRPN